YTGGQWRPAPGTKMGLWDVVTGKELRSFPGWAGWDTVRRVAFCPDGRHAFSAGSDRVLRLWDLDTGQEVRRFVGHPGEVTIMALSPDGRYVLSGNEGRHEAGKFVPDLKPVIRFWDVSTGKEVHQLR